MFFLPVLLLLLLESVFILVQSKVKVKSEFLLLIEFLRRLWYCYQEEVFRLTTGQLIKDARKKAGMTQKELADKLGLSFQAVAQWENDLRNPKYDTLEKIARALGVATYTLTQASGSFESAIKEARGKLEIEEDIDDFVEERARSHADYMALWDTTVKETALKYGIDPAILGLYVPRRGEAMDQPSSEIAVALRDLNEEGRKEAAKRVKELTWIPWYKKKDPNKK